MLCPKCGSLIDESNHYRCARFPICDYQMEQSNQEEKRGSESFIMFDLETTGLDRRKDRIIEIGAIMVKQGKIVDRFSMLLNPGKTQSGTQIFISCDITRITGITNQDLLDAPLESEGVERFLDWCEDISLVIGHNISGFDIPFLRYACKRAGKQLPFTQIIDTLKMVRAMQLKKLGKIENEKQTTLARYCGFTYHAHRALDDVEALYRIYQYLRNEYTPIPMAIKEKEG